MTITIQVSDDYSASALCADAAVGQQEMFTGVSVLVLQTESVLCSIRCRKTVPCSPNCVKQMCAHVLRVSVTPLVHIMALYVLHQDVSQHSICFVSIVTENMILVLFDSR